HARAPHRHGRSGRARLRRPPRPRTRAVPAARVRLLPTMPVLARAHAAAAWLRAHPCTTCTVVLMVLMAVYVVASPAADPFVGDPSNYWLVSGTFEDNGFSLRNYDDRLRGYAFPFLLFASAQSVSRWTNHLNILVWVIPVVLAPVLIGIVVPQLAKLVSN